MVNSPPLGVMKSVMGELTDSTNRAEGFSLLPVVWGFGATMGYVSNVLFLDGVYLSPGCRPLIGGTLSRPQERFPDTFKGAFWRIFPYFLPCLVPAGYVLCAFLVTLLFFKEVCIVLTTIKIWHLSLIRQFQSVKFPLGRLFLAAKTVLTRSIVKKNLCHCANYSCTQWSYRFQIMSTWP